MDHGGTVSENENDKQSEPTEEQLAELDKCLDVAVNEKCSARDMQVADYVLTTPLFVSGLTREAVALAVSSTRTEERTRCLRILDDVIKAAEARRPKHHATPWLQAVRDAVASGQELAGVDVTLERA
jgi:hypothetical protein